MAMHKYTAEDDAFILTAPTYKILEQSTLPAFLKLMDGLGEYNKSRAFFKMNNGGICYARTGHEPDSIVGITNVRHILCDEAGKYTLYFWINIQGRSSFKQSPITIVTSPYSLNWLYKDLIKPSTRGERDDILLIQARSDENPYFPKEEFERVKKTMSPLRFNSIYGGQFEKMEGLVYDCFSDGNNVVDPFDLPIGTKYYAGIDWGHTQPMCLLIRAITPTGYQFQVSETYRTGLTIMDIIIIAKQKKQIWGIERFYADPSEPGYIEQFNREGLTCVKAKNDIRVGIDRHYELVKTGRFKIFKGAGRHSIDEYESYHWPEAQDLRPDQDIKERVPVKQDDHAMDAARYLTNMTWHLVNKKPMKAPLDKTGVTAQGHINNLMKRKPKRNRMETWR